MNDRSAWHERLKTERERRGLSLLDISDRTRIRLVYLEIIESGEIQKLPGEIFVKGFVRAYASALGVDFRSIQGDLKGDLAAVFRGGRGVRDPEEGWEYRDPWWKALLRMPRWPRRSSPERRGVPRLSLHGRIHRRSGCPAPGFPRKPAPRPAGPCGGAGHWTWNG